jgi:DNA-binding NarL/FixJ family response regulator
VEARAELGVLLIEDDSMVRGWVRLAFADSEFRLAGEAASAAEALDLAARRRPDVLLVDYRLPDALGTQLVRDLRDAGIRAPAVLMTANPERGFNEAAREGGAQGTTLKSGSPGELLGALRSVLRGDEAFDGRHPPRPPGRAALSPREREVVRLVAGGATNREVAKALDVGEETVKTLLARTYAKLGVRRRAEAVAEAQKQGLL